MVRIHVGQPFDSDLASFDLRSWQAIRSEIGVECPEPAEGLSAEFPRHMFDEISFPEPIDARAFVYILESEDGTYYIGQSRDVRERLRKHRLGLGSKHTRDHPKTRLVFWEGPTFPSEAVRRERQLKGWTRAKKRALIVGDVAALKTLAGTSR